MGESRIVGRRFGSDVFGRGGRGGAADAGGVRGEARVKEDDDEDDCFGGVEGSVVRFKAGIAVADDGGHRDAILSGILSWNK